MKKKLQVFVSSTFTDLIIERQAAVSAILKMGHIPAGMELFTANDKSQWDTIKEWIDESDVYMLILGGRYGSVDEVTGLSYTELEFNYALETKKPLFSVVITEDALEKKVRDCGSDFLEKKRQSELTFFRDKVLSNMCSFFEDVKDIKLCVMESLPTIASTRELSGWVSGSDVPNTAALFDEINSLKGINKTLEMDLDNISSELDKLRAKNKSNDDDFETLAKLLQAIELEVPIKTKDEGPRENVKRDLFQLFNSICDSLVTGITNRSGQDDLYYYIYNSVCPKLHIHQLVSNEKVTGASYRRFALTAKGQAFAAYNQKKKLLSL